MVRVTPRGAPSTALPQLAATAEHRSERPLAIEQRHSPPPIHHSNERVRTVIELVIVKLLNSSGAAFCHEKDPGL